MNWNRSSLSAAIALAGVVALLAVISMGRPRTGTTPAVTAGTSTGRSLLEPER